MVASSGPLSVFWHGKPLGSDGPSLSREDPEECLQLAKLWDAGGLLAVFHCPHPSGLAYRVFNAHKNELVDRQLGDRRWFNAAECHPRGPSASLPSEHHMVSLHCPPGYKLVGCAADCKDSYHQARVSRERAFTNLLPFEYEVEGVCHLQAWKDMLVEGARPVTCETHGDSYGMPPVESIYRREGVLGSDDKTVCGAEFFKVVGAEIWSDAWARGAGIISVTAPLSKRIPMMALSLRAAALPVISRILASRLAGNWISVRMFRRCLCCVLSRLDPFKSYGR